MSVRKKTVTGSPSILIVDDEASSLSLLKGILVTEGYCVRSSDSGRLALASLAGWLPELILLDIRMPGMNGFEVYRRLRAIEKLHNVPGYVHQCGERTRRAALKGWRWAPSITSASRFGGKNCWLGFERMSSLDAFAETSKNR